MNSPPGFTGYSPLRSIDREPTGMAQTWAEDVTANLVTRILDMTVRTRKIQLAPFGPVNLTAFLLPLLCTGLRVIDSHGLTIKLRSIMCYQACHLSDLDVLDRFLAIRLKASIDVSN